MVAGGTAAGLIWTSICLEIAFFAWAILKWAIIAAAATLGRHFGVHKVGGDGEWIL